MELLSTVDKFIVHNWESNQSLWCSRLDGTLLARPGIRTYYSSGLSRVGQSMSLKLNILICMPKFIREPMVMRLTFLFYNSNTKSKHDVPVIISSLAFTLETKMSSDSLCPTWPILPQLTKFRFSFILSKLWSLRHLQCPTFIHSYRKWYNAVIYKDVARYDQIVTLRRNQFWCLNEPLQ